MVQHGRGSGTRTPNRFVMAQQSAVELGDRATDRPDEPQRADPNGVHNTAVHKSLLIAIRRTHGQCAEERARPAIRTILDAQQLDCFAENTITNRRLMPKAEPSAE